MAESVESALLTVHPEYTEYTNKWPFWIDSSQGGAKFVGNKNYLIKHPREQDEPGAFEFRLALAAYESHGKQVADDWISRLLGPGLDLSIVSPAEADKRSLEFFNGVSADLDLLGTDLRSFTKKILFKAITLGACGVVVDVSSDQPVENLSQAIISGVRPYCRAFNPPDILDWEFDRRCQLNWIKIRELAQSPRDWNSPPSGRIPVQTEIALASQALVRNNVYRYYILDRQSIRRFEPINDGASHVEAEPVFHNLGQVPFQMFYGKSPDAGHLFTEPLIEEIYWFDHLIYNTRSGLTDLMFNQMFPILTVAVMGGNSFDKTMGVGGRRAFGYPMGSGSPPNFIGPDARLVEAHLKAIEDCEKAIKRIAKFGGMTSVDDKVREASGRSKAFEADPLTTQLRSIGDEQEPAFRNLFNLIHKRSAYGEKTFTGRAKFPDSIVLRGVLEEREDCAAAMEILSPSETALKVLIQHFANQVLPSIWTDEQRDLIMKEIEAAPLNAILQRLSQDGGNNVGGNDDTGSSSDSGTGRPLERAPRDQEQPGPSVRAA